LHEPEGGKTPRTRAWRRTRHGPEQRAARGGSVPIPGGRGRNLGQPRKSGIVRRPGESSGCLVWKKRGTEGERKRWASFPSTYNVAGGAGVSLSATWARGVGAPRMFTAMTSLANSALTCRHLCACVAVRFSFGFATRTSFFVPPSEGGWAPVV